MNAFYTDQPVRHATRGTATVLRWVIDPSTGSARYWCRFPGEPGYMPWTVWCSERELLPLRSKS